MKPSSRWDQQFRRFGIEPPPTTASEKEADLLFDELNRRYWRGRLPKYPVKRWDTGKRIEGGLDRLFDVIILDERIKSRRKLRRLLLHEMCHIGPSMRDLHGPRWLRKVTRLVRLGETDLQQDLDQYATPFLRKLHSYLVAGRRDLFRKAVKESVEAGGPRVTVTTRW